MLSSLDAAAVHPDWVALWGEKLPEAIKSDMLADPRIRHRLFERIADTLGANPLDTPVDGRVARLFGVYMSDPDLVLTLVGLALHADRLVGVVAGSELRQLVELHGRDEIAFAVGCRDVLPSDRSAGNELPSPEDLLAEAETAIRFWFETLPDALADRAVLTLPRDVHVHADSRWDRATQIRVAETVIERLEAIGE